MKRSKLFYLIPALAFMACSKDSVEDYEDIGTTEPTTEVVEGAEGAEILTEAANLEAPGTVSDVYFGGQQIPVEQYNNEYVYQGDIILTRDMVSFQEEKIVYEEGETPPANKSVARTSDRWPDNTVYYSIDTGLPNQDRVIEAIQHWEENTNLRFVKRSGQSNYIYFTTGSGCSSYIGMIGGKQNITLSSGCSTGNTIHEIGHAVGLWHEQSRVDRNSYITIKYDNIQSGREQNFDTYEDMNMDGKELTEGLDFGSIMLYDSYSFSGNGKPTMVKKDGSTFNAQRRGLSSGDITGINLLYPQGNSGKETAPSYENGNFYYLEGANVLRYNDRWYFQTNRFGYKAVFQKGDNWYFL